MTTMRERFYDLTRAALDEDERVAVVTAQIGTEAIVRAISTSESASS
jgi:hypothetical protein